MPRPNWLKHFSLSRERLQWALIPLRCVTAENKLLGEEGTCQRSGDERTSPGLRSLFCVNPTSLQDMPRAASFHKPWKIEATFYLKYIRGSYHVSLEKVQAGPMCIKFKKSILNGCNVLKLRTTGWEKVELLLVSKLAPIYRSGFSSFLLCDLEGSLHFSGLQSYSVIGREWVPWFECEGSSQAHVCGH